MDQISVTTKTVEPVSLVPGRYEAVRTDIDRFLVTAKTLQRDPVDLQSIIDDVAVAFYDMKMSEVLVGAEYEDTRDLSDLVFAVLFNLLSESPPLDLLTSEIIFLLVVFYQECSNYPSKVSITSLESLRHLAERSKIVKLLLPKLLVKSLICSVTQAPYFDKSGVVYESSPKAHQSLEKGCPTGRHAFFKNGRVEDEEGNVVIDIAAIQDPQLKSRLMVIAQELDNIIPPPAPAIVETTTIPKKRPRNPRGISQVKKLSYSVTLPQDSEDILLQDLLERS